jgi:colanic acid/amylovoran biosynthesis glycosyltransferase
MTAPDIMIAHYVRTYLARSATFIHTQLRFQPSRPRVVFAPDVANEDEFPVDRLVRLHMPEMAKPLRAAHRARAAAAGYANAHDHRFARGLRSCGANVIHAHFGTGAWFARPVAERTSTPMVVTFYGYDLALPARDELWQKRYDEVFALGSAFVCEGPAMARQLRGIGCPDGKVRIVKIGLDLEQFDFRPRFPGARRPLVFVQTARFVDKKGVDLSIRAFAAAREQMGDSELWLVGDGDTRADLERLAAKLGVSGKVRFLGMLPHDEYREALRRADVGIQPSRTAADGDTEGGAPTVLLEMQATGVPVVSTRHADIPEVVAAGEALADEGDVEGIARAMVRVARLEADEWNDRCRAGRALVEREHDARVAARALHAIHAEAAGALAASA